MRKRLLLSLVLLAGLAVAVVWFRINSPPAATNTPTVHDPGIEAVSNHVATSKTESEPSPAERRGINLFKSVEYLNKLQQHTKRMNGPVEFYGQIVDQQKQPVPGVRLKLQLSIYNENLLKAMDDRKAVETEGIELTTDRQGRFGLSGRRGSSLFVEKVGREGYVWIDPGLGSFSFGSNATPANRDYANPAKGVTFHVWRKGPTDPVIQVQKRVRIKERGGDYLVNLLSSERGAESITKPDLVIRLRFIFPQENGHEYDQTMILEAPGGGLVETKDAYPYLAVESGYQSRYECQVKPSHLTGDGWKRKYYLRTRGDNLYASLEVKLTLFPYVFEINAIINPHGSRNLEPDPAKQITDEAELRRLDLETSQ